MVPHNVKGLFDRVGGNATVVNRLNSFFHNTDGSWALTNAGGLKSELDNEPSIWVPWLFPQIVVRRSNGVTLTVSAPGASANTKYVQSLTVNGASSNRSWLPESFVTNGGTLAYTLGTNPNTSWASATADAPPSFDG
jgi:putative alpha-1,2-mannosidase